ncbi:MAG: aminoglycoside 6-adenylyltransferase [Clostridia bacterium]|nr:aminoglycoside 6-adenylyltransferase [Clostridia bacterium]
MQTNADLYLGLEKRFAAFAQGEERIAAAVIIGSRARSDPPADAYSDLDMLLVVDDPAFFLSTDDWLRRIGAFHISFEEDTVGGLKERRVLFDGALDVDFVFLPEVAVAAALRSREGLAIFGRGHRVLIDKRGLATSLPAKGARPPSVPPPGEAEFLHYVNDFWYHAVWTAKKLLRGELWTAMSCLDCYMKRKLLWMIERHARATQGPDCDTWHGGRFLDTWADADTKRALRHAFARYDTEDIGRALFATMDLFRDLARETAEKLGFCYPSQADRAATEWVSAALR